MLSQGTRLSKDGGDFLFQQIAHRINIMDRSILDDTNVTNPYRPSCYSTAAGDDYSADQPLRQHSLDDPHAGVESLNESNEEFASCLPRRVHKFFGRSLIACHRLLDEKILASFNRQRTHLQVSLGGCTNRDGLEIGHAKKFSDV